MNFFDNIIAWVKANILLSIGILIAVVVILFPKVLKKLFGTTRRIKHHRVTTVPARRRRLPRSVGFYRNKSSVKRISKAKKPWQVKGSLAAKRHMAQIRRMR